MFHLLYFRAGSNQTIIFQKNLDHFNSASPVSLITLFITINAPSLTSLPLFMRKAWSNAIQNGFKTMKFLYIYPYLVLSRSFLGLLNCSAPKVFITINTCTCTAIWCHELVISHSDGLQSTGIIYCNWMYESYIRFLAKKYGTISK